MRIRVSFTGYRPSKFSFGFDEECNECLELKTKIYDTIKNLCEKGAEIFFTGMAMGIDIWCAETVFLLKKDFPNIELYCALPCENQDNGWNENYKQRYANILKQADKIIYVNRIYSRNCMKERNKYLVQNCDILVAVYDGQKGGTKQTVEMAEKSAKTIIFITP